MEKGLNTYLWIGMFFPTVFFTLHNKRLKDNNNFAEISTYDKNCRFPLCKVLPGPLQYTFFYIGCTLFKLHACHVFVQSFSVAALIHLEHKGFT